MLFDFKNNDCFFKNLKQKTYYPELKQKSLLRIMFDHIKHYLKYGHFDFNNYFLCGLDIRDYRSASDFLDYKTFMKRRDWLNNHPSNRQQYSYTGILHDKFCFAVFMEGLGFNVPITYGITDKNVVYSFRQKANVAIDVMLNDEIDLIAKPVNGEGDVGIFTIEFSSGNVFMNKKKVEKEVVISELKKRKFLIQHLIKNQHPDMEKLYPKAINTVRVTTVRDVNTGKIELIGSMLLMGDRDAIVSNWHYGGVIINIEENGYLNKYGFSRLDKKITQHPDSGVVFETFKVPFYEKCVSEAIRCHELLYGIHSIGWDFAILPNDVYFIEGNDNWGMAAHQMVGGGLMEKFNKYFFYH